MTIKTLLTLDEQLYLFIILTDNTPSNSSLLMSLGRFPTANHREGAIDQVEIWGARRGVHSPSPFHTYLGIELSLRNATWASLAAPSAFSIIDGLPGARSVTVVLLSVCKYCGCLFVVSGKLISERGLATICLLRVICVKINYRTKEVLVNTWGSV